MLSYMLINALSNLNFVFTLFTEHVIVFGICFRRGSRLSVTLNINKSILLISFILFPESNLKLLSILLSFILISIFLKL